MYVFFICFQKLRHKKLTELEFFNPIVACCQGILRSCKSASKYGCSSPFGFRVMAFLMIFFKKKLRCKKPCCCQGTFRGLQIWRANVIAQILYYFMIFFQKHLRYKKLTELEFLNPIVGCCQGTFRGCKSGV